MASPDCPVLQIPKDNWPILSKHMFCWKVAERNDLVLL